MAFIVSFAISAFAEFPSFGSNLERRQLGDCSTPCAWFSNLATCSETDVTCVCGVITQAGSSVATCANCLQTVNATLAADVIQVEQLCQTGSVTTAPVRTTEAPSQPTGNQCNSQCSLINEALDVCTDDTCFCPTVVAEGPACSQCFAMVNVTEANLIGSVITGCVSEFPSLATANPITATASGANPCSTQCAVVANAASTCADNSCFCPTFLELGPACSSCWATVNATEASLLGSLLTDCMTAGGTTAGTHPLPTTTGQTTSIRIASTSSSKSGAQVGIGELFGAGYVHYIMFLAILAGLFTVLV